MPATPWTNEEKANIRAYLGYPSLFHDQNPRLENAINSIADDSILNDDGETQTRMRAVLTKLSALEDKIEDLHCTAFVESAGQENVKINPIKAIHYLKSEGRRLIAQLAIPLGTEPMRDYFSASDINPSPHGSVFPYGYEG